jgi:hypothetical protein
MSMKNKIIELNELIKIEIVLGHQERMKNEMLSIYWIIYNVFVKNR